MKYRTKFIIRDMWIERHKVTRLLVACLSGENQFEVVIIDDYCPDADVGGGAFGDSLFSQTFPKYYGSIT
jgi:hypothetical protein